MAGYKQHRGTTKLRFNGKRISQMTLTEVIAYCTDVFVQADNMLYEGEDLNKVYGHIARQGIVIECEGVE